MATQEPGVKIELAAEGCECARPSFCAALTLGARSEMKAKRPMRGKCWLGKGGPGFGLTFRSDSENGMWLETYFHTALFLSFLL